MELVPIVYTALALVAILAVIVISISYVSFKIKEKNGLIETPLVKEQINSLSNPVKKVVQKITKPLQISHHEQKIKNKEDKISSKSKIPSSKNNAQQNEKEKKNISPNRFEVVKKIKEDKLNLEFDKPRTPPATQKDDSKFKTLENNVIDNYSDDQNKEMFTLDIKKKDNKKN